MSESVTARPEVGAGARQKPKRASGLADAIETEIVESKREVGDLLGSEPDLISRYGVSRAVFREAVRLLEQREVAHMRRGPGGGLIVTAPQESVVRRAAATLLRFEKVEVQELVEARVDIELACLALTVQRIDEAGVTQLRELVDHEAGIIRGHGRTHELRNFHVELAALSDNRPLWLFVSILTDLQGEFSPSGFGSPRSKNRRLSPTGAAASHTAHAAIVEAVVQQDVALAIHRMRRHLAAVSDFSLEYMTTGISAAPERRPRRRTDPKHTSS
jgi:DNA-binding FadR family transcriptional regulator